VIEQPATSGLPESTDESAPVEISTFEDLEASIAQWLPSAGIAFHLGDLQPEGDWLAVFTEAMLPAVACEPTHLIQPRCPLFEFSIGSGLPRLTAGAELPSTPWTVLAPGPKQCLPTRTLLWLYQAGASACWLFEAGAWEFRSIEIMLTEALYLKRVRPFIQWLSPSLQRDDSLTIGGMAQYLHDCRSTEPCDDSEASESRFLESPKRISVTSGQQRWEEEIERDNASYVGPGIPEGRELRVVQYIGSLSSGGAERQLCNLSIGLTESGIETRVRTAYPLDNELGHYSALLEEASIEAGVPRRSNLGSSHPIRWDLLAAAPRNFRSFTTQLAIELAENPPDVLHTWLDHPNIMGGLAAIAAGVPTVLFSTRNSNPTNFPRLYHPDLDTWYRVLARSHRVHWLANSHSGAKSYSDWLGIPLEKIHVVLNGVFHGHFATPSESARREARHKYGIDEGTPLVVVANRLSEEKQPELMLKVISMVKQDIPGLKVLVAGAGPLEGRIRQIIKRRRLSGCIQLLGRISDVTSLFQAADVLLLTSTLEGCPNVALEAQHLGTPVVATAGGGTSDAIIDGRTGFLCGVHDPVGLALRVREVLGNADLRRQMGAAGKRFVDQCFSTQQMVELTTKAYHSMLPAETGPQIVTPMPGLESRGQTDIVIHASTESGGWMTRRGSVRSPAGPS
jgi:glycosyltransferase involved in cell wall biosynthesis